MGKRIGEYILIFFFIILLTSCSKENEVKKGEFEAGDIYLLLPLDSEIPEHFRQKEKNTTIPDWRIKGAVKGAYSFYGANESYNAGSGGSYIHFGILEFNSSVYAKEYYDKEIYWRETGTFTRPEIKSPDNCVSYRYDIVGQGSIDGYCLKGKYFYSVSFTPVYGQERTIEDYYEKYLWLMYSKFN